MQKEALEVQEDFSLENLFNFESKDTNTMISFFLLILI